MRLKSCLPAFIVFSIIMLFCSSFMEGTALGRVLDVCPSGCSYPTIDRALSQASDGDIIRIAEGNYKGNTIEIEDKHIRLEGGWNHDFTKRSLDAGKTILDSGIMVTIIRDGGEIEISGLTIAGAPGNGITISCSSPNQEITASARLTNVVIRQAEGEAVRIEGARAAMTVDMSNCLITNNRGGISFADAGRIPVGADRMVLSLTNSTIALNHGPGLVVRGTSVTVTNSILWKNAIDISGYGYTTPPTVWGDIYLAEKASATVEYSLYGVLNNSGSDSSFIDRGNNLSGVQADPRFINPEKFDLHLSPSSPCIDTGQPLAGPGVDFEGDPRPIGNGTDMGADEFDPCAYDNTGPGPVSWLTYEITPREITLNWTNPTTLPCARIDIVNKPAAGPEKLLGSVTPPQHSLVIRNQFWGTRLKLLVTTYDDCGNAGQSEETELEIPAYKTISCPCGGIDHPSLAAEIRLSNLATENNHFFAYGFDAKGNETWSEVGIISPHATRTLRPSGGISALIYASAEAAATLQLKGENGISATLPGAVETSTTLFLPENACSDSWWTGTVIFNPNDTDVEVNFTSNAVSYVSDTFTLAPRGSLVFMPPCQILAGTFHATAPVSGMVLVGNQEIQGMDFGAMLLTGKSDTIFSIPGIHEGVDAWTGFAIYEPFASPVPLEIRAALKTTGFSRDVSYGSIAPYTRKALELSERNLKAVNIGIQDASGQPVQCAGMLLQSSLAGFDFLNPGFLSTATPGILAGFDPQAKNSIFLMNLQEEKITVLYTMYDFQGGTIETDSFVLDPGATTEIPLTSAQVQNLAFMKLVPGKPISGYLEIEGEQSLDLLPFIRSN